MHGVPADLDLSHFLGAMLERIDFGIHIIHFRFAAEPPGVIGVEGDWELFGPAGDVIDQHVDVCERAAFRLHVIVGRDVVGVEVSPPDWFALTFNSGHRLRVYDRSRQYESFSIQPGNLYI